MNRNVRFAENLKIHRGKKGLTQEQIADKVHVSRQTVSNWEKAVSYPDIYMLANLCNLFDVSADELLFGKEPQEKAIVQQQEIVTQRNVFYDERDYISEIRKKGFYDIIQEDVQTFFPIINIEFVHIMGIAKELKELGYNITSIYGNGFSVYLSTDKEANKFRRILGNILDEFMHGETERTAFAYVLEVGSRIDAIENEIVRETEKIIFGSDVDDMFYWIDEDERIRGYGKNEEECIEQAKSQECLNYMILHG